MIENTSHRKDKGIVHKDKSFFKSLKLHSECLANLENISKVIFIGSSGTGKTYIQRAVISAARNDIQLSGKISVPRRIVTRSPRVDDDQEILHYSPEELETMARNGKLGLYGIKTMENGRKEPFGLEKPEAGKLPIFFANNVIAKNPQTILPRSLFENALIIGMYTPDRQREIRLRQRSPELFERNEAEVKFRLSEEESSRIVIPISNVVVKNFGRFEDRVEGDVIKLLKLIVSGKEKKLSTEVLGRKLKNHYMILRHGKSVANEEKLIISHPNNGSTNFGLTQKGEDQIRLTAFLAKNNGVKIDAVITSPFNRCVSSATNFAKVYGFDGPVVTRAELGERYFGIFDGRQKIHYQTIYRADQDSPKGSSVYRAETPEDVFKRAMSLIKEIEKTTNGKTILLVTHSDVGEIIQAGLQGLLPETHRFTIPKLENGQLRVIA